MKWNYYPLAHGDPKAKTKMLDNLGVAAHGHTLSRKLLSRFADAMGPLLLIAFESLDLDAECLYEYATYDGGKGLREVPGSESISWMDCPRWGLVTFLDKHLLGSSEAVVLFENWAATRDAVTKYPRESRLLLYGDEVYHILTSADAASADAIECAIRESEHHWSTGVCSSCDRLPVVDIPSEAFFDEIVARTVHIFTPALDGEGYLIWSPSGHTRE